jgi:hypothetical protein
VPKADYSFDLSAYALVAERIALFYSRFPTGRIITELVARTDREVTFRASIFRATEDVAPAATGWASEREGDGDINTVACLENTETSAIGRALANLGFTASRQRPSREEMEKAQRARSRVAEAAAAAPLAPHVVAPSPARDRYATLLADVLAVLDIAERRGMRPARAALIRRHLADARFTPALLVDIERRLRRRIAGAANTSNQTGEMSGRGVSSHKQRTMRGA